MSGRAMRDECARPSRTGRPPLHSSSSAGPRPAGIAPFDVRAGDVYCVIDPAAPEPATLEAAFRLARLLAMAGLREQRRRSTARRSARRSPPSARSWRRSRGSSRR